MGRAVKATKSSPNPTASYIRELEIDCPLGAEEDELDFYAEFMNLYPEYSGSRNAFARALVNIEWIAEQEKFLPCARYDDFIRVLASEWLSYVDKNRDLGSELMSGLKYYTTHFPDQPTFDFKFITGENLQDALASLDAEKVANYRAAYRQPHQIEAQGTHHSTSPQSTLTVAVTHQTENRDTNEHASDEDRRTVRTVDTKAGLILSRGREASPVLGSAKGSIFSENHGVSERSPSPFNVREASPELGSVGDLSGSFNHGPRKRFFETFSQMLPEQPQPETPKSHRSGIMNPTPSNRFSNIASTLPWKKSDSSRSSNSSTTKGNFASPTASTPQGHGRLPSTDQWNESSPSGQPREPSTSLARSYSSRPWKRVKTNSSGGPHDNPSAHKRHAMPASHVTPRIPQDLRKKIVKSERLTPGRPMVQAFLARRQRNGSTPKTTPGKRFCTKPIETPPGRLEPEIQVRNT